MELFGADATETSGKLALQRSSSHADPFERGQKDTFAVSGSRVRTPERLLVWCGNSSGGEQSWRVDWISVQQEGAAEQLVFKFGDWVPVGATVSACAAA